MFNATGIEHAFAIFLERAGQREYPYDADVFRSGDPQSLGELMELLADHFGTRLKRLRFTREESFNAGAVSHLEVAIARLSAQAAKLKESQTHEPGDYHWEIIGHLVLGIAGLLKHSEKRTAELN